MYRIDHTVWLDKLLLNLYKVIILEVPTFMDFTALIYAFLWHIDSNLTPNIYYSSIRTTFSGNHIFFYQVCNHNFTTNKISTIKYLKPTKRGGWGCMWEDSISASLFNCTSNPLAFTPWNDLKSFKVALWFQIN